MNKKNPIMESRRYVDNARQVLEQHGRLNEKMNIYEDEKYVRAAGNYLWLGVLMALDAVFHVRKDRRTRVNINSYLEAVGKRDRKLLTWVDKGYDVMHLYMYYDGASSKGVCDDGFRLANAIIDRCATMLAS